MGNTYSSNQDSFYMHLRFIGQNMNRFYRLFKSSVALHNIIKFWEIDSLQNTDYPGK